MATLSITTAWNETTQFVQRESRLLFPIAFLLIALPAGIIQLFMPTPGAPPSEVFAALALVIPLALIGGILGMIGTIALSYLALRPGASVGEALQAGGRRFIFLFVAWLLIGIAAALALIPFVVVAALTSGQAAQPNQLSPAAALLLLVYFAGFLAVWIRLMLTTPIAAVEKAGPIEMLTRSWNLTRGHFWRLLGFAILFALAAGIAIFAISAIVGIVIFLIAGPPLPGTTSMILVLLVWAILQSAASVLAATLISRIYAQLSGFGREGVFT